MNLKYIAQMQYQKTVDAVRKQPMIKHPKAGWIRTVRQALGMSLAQLGSRLGRTRVAVSKNEKAEVTGQMTLKTLTMIADALECDLAYQLVPRKPVQDIIKTQAYKKATKIVQTASMHMSLEDQALSKADNEAKITRIADELIRDLPKDLWD